MAGKAPTNPFYSHRVAAVQSNQPASPPPAYSRPTPVEPVTYGSLSDLTKGRQVPKPPAPAPPSRPSQSNSAYGSPSRNTAGEQSGSGWFGSGGNAAAGSGTAPIAGRHMPPPPSNYGRDPAPPPPRRNVEPVDRTTTGTPPTRFESARNTAASYVPNSVSATAYTVGDRVKDGFEGIATKERRDQVAAGAGKVAAGAAKLAGKAAWNLGKFASSSKS